MAAASREQHSLEEKLAFVEARAERSTDADMARGPLSWIAFI